MAELTETNLKVVMRVHERLRDYPDTHNQGSWYELGYESCDCEAEGEEECGCIFLVEDDLMEAALDDSWSEGLAIDAQAMRECGTTACLAGHAVCAAIELGVQVPEDTDGTIEELGAKLLGLHGQQVERAFYHSSDEGIRYVVARAAERGEWPEW